MSDETTSAPGTSKELLPSASPREPDDGALAEALAKTEAVPAIEVQDEELPSRTPAGLAGKLATVLCVALSLYALYWVIGVVEPFVYRVSFLLIVMVLVFLLYPSKAGRPSLEPRVIPWTDWAWVIACIVALGWPLVDLAHFQYRASTPTQLDVALGALTIALVLETTRRTNGPILPATALVFLLYAYLGPLFELIGLGLFAHRGYYPDRLIGTLYMSLEGIFGVPLDVATTYIVLFTIFGAVLDRSGAGKFFVDWSLAAMGRGGRGSGPGRAVTAAGFLLGTVSGSGVATTVTLGTVSWPLLRRAGYKPEVAGAILAAGGIGAILSPPTLGAAAFLIAEFLKISYLQVLVAATVPTILYYVSIFLMIEADSRRMGARAIDVAMESVWTLTKRYGHFFGSLVAIVVFLVLGMTPFRAVFWATVLAFALSFVRRETALHPRAAVDALASGGRGVLAVTATTATAGIIVGVVTLTGLGLKIAGIIVALAGGSLFLTVTYAAIAVWMLGLAVPVTASYIIAAVMIAPALTQVGVPPFAAHMFIFYYAVLSEVSPPTALSPFAAAAITGGNPFRTMMLTWKYTLPAFLVPFAFTLSPGGRGLLLEAPPLDVIRATLTAIVGVAALAMGFGGWLRKAVTLPERIMAIAAGLLLIDGHSWSDLAGMGLLGLVVAMHLVRTAGGGSSVERGVVSTLDAQRSTLE